jgi:hypothetical protein
MEPLWGSKYSLDPMTIINGTPPAFVIMNS